jgi:predicted nucleotidyltransferase
MPSLSRCDECGPFYYGIFSSPRIGTKLGNHHMYTHHIESIQHVSDYFQQFPEVQALLLGGSIAHGYERATSDIDIMIIVSPEDYERRLKNEAVHFFNRELCTYEEGYVDGKFLSMGFLRKVAECGSEPARFAFSGALVLFSRVDGLETVIQQIAQYPAQKKVSRIQRFNAQFEAWNWYCGEALRQQNRYLLGVSVNKLALFGGRMILAHNQLLYPYHKWFLKVLESAPDKPMDLLARIHALCSDHSAENVQAFYECVRNFRAWETAETGWPNQFMLDSELNWMMDSTPVDDV